MTASRTPDALFGRLLVLALTAVLVLGCDAGDGGDGRPGPPAEAGGAAAADRGCVEVFDPAA
ncbi:MAG: hypothetical protein AAFX50_14220, partial [Acidobacteriota bacterium]